MQDSLTAGRPFRLFLRAYSLRLSLTHKAFTWDEITMRVSSSASVPPAPTVPTRGRGGLGIDADVGEVVGADVGVDEGTSLGTSLDWLDESGGGPQNDGSRTPPVQTTDLIHSNW